jgi:isochorismate synthase
MSIEQAIAGSKYESWIVLPVEFDPTRNTQHFQLKGELFQSDQRDASLIVEPFQAYSGIASQPETTKAQHAQVIADALKSIQEGRLTKVVVSCIKHETRSSKSLDEIFKQLIENYPNAFVFALNHPQHGVWMGATPELLLRKEGQHFQTVSLAGTQSYTANNEIIWSDKLKQEQSVVTDFIIESIRDCAAKQVTINGPFTSYAGPLAHLKTEIRFTGEMTSHEIIKNLQPTPAICGVPREEAMKFIETHSNFDRRLYAGRMGLVMPDNRELHFVTLRCMQVFSDHFEIHVGGGIVAQSNAEEEWNETEMKASVLRTFLH